MTAGSRVGLIVAWCAIALTWLVLDNQATAGVISSEEPKRDFVECYEDGALMLPREVFAEKCFQPRRSGIETSPVKVVRDASTFATACPFQVGRHEVHKGDCGTSSASSAASAVYRKDRISIQALTGKPGQFVLINETRPKRIEMVAQVVPGGFGYLIGPAKNGQLDPDAREVVAVYLENSVPAYLNNKKYYPKTFRVELFLRGSSDAKWTECKKHFPGYASGTIDCPLPSAPTFEIKESSSSGGSEPPPKNPPFVP